MSKRSILRSKRSLLMSKHSILRSKHLILERVLASIVSTGVKFILSVNVIFHLALRGAY